MIEASAMKFLWKIKCCIQTVCTKQTKNIGYETRFTYQVLNDKIQQYKHQWRNQRQYLDINIMNNKIKKWTQWRNPTDSKVDCSGETT